MELTSELKPDTTPETYMPTREDFMEYLFPDEIARYLQGGEYHWFYKLEDNTKE